MPARILPWFTAQFRPVNPAIISRVIQVSLQRIFSPCKHHAPRFGCKDIFIFFIPSSYTCHCHHCFLFESASLTLWLAVMCSQFFRYFFRSAHLPASVSGFHRSRDVRIDSHCHIYALPIFVCFISLHLHHGDGNSLHFPLALVLVTSNFGSIGDNSGEQPNFKSSTREFLKHFHGDESIPIATSSMRTSYFAEVHWFANVLFWESTPKLCILPVMAVSAGVHFDRLRCH